MKYFRSCSAHKGNKIYLLCLRTDFRSNSVLTIRYNRSDQKGRDFKRVEEANNNTNCFHNRPKSNVYHHCVTGSEIKQIKQFFLSSIY